MKIHYGLARFAALVAALTVASAKGQETAVVKDDHVNVRGQPKMNSEVVTRLKKGESVTILEEITPEKPRKGEPPRWYRIVLPVNTPVWVNLAFIDPTNKTVLSKRLNVRAGAGENYSVLGRLEKGAPVKEISQKNTWLEIEAPTNAYAFVAADLVAKNETAPPTAPPVTVVRAPAAPPPTTIIDTTPPPVVAVLRPPPAAVETRPPPPVIAPPPAAVETVPAKRIVRREGTVKSTLSIQAPTYYELRNMDSGRPVNYLHTTSTNLSLKTFKDKRIFVTGEEFLDKRWPNTPVLEIETIEILP